LKDSRVRFPVKSGTQEVRDQKELDQIASRQETERKERPTAGNIRGWPSHSYPPERSQLDPSTEAEVLEEELR